MTVPGFNAETSLYKTSIHYYLIGGLVPADSIVLQQFGLALKSCFDQCRIRCAEKPFPFFLPCYRECVWENCT